MSFTPEPLGHRILVHVGEQLGPTLDVLDVVDESGLSVREVIQHFARQEPAASPAEVRAAMQDLIEARLLAPTGLDRSGLVMQADSQVRITCRGLVAARQISPNCGRTTRRLTLTTMRGKPMIDARLGTGDKEQDASLSKSPTVLRAAYIVLVIEPTKERPLLVEQCAQYFERLEMHSNRHRPGPSSTKVTSPEAIRSALESLGKVLNLSRGYFDEDKRRDFFYLAGPLPEVIVEAGDRRHFGDWQSFRHVLWCIVEGHSLGGIVDVQDHLFPPAANSGEAERTRQKAAQRPTKKERAALPAGQRPARRKLGDVATDSGN